MVAVRRGATRALWTAVSRGRAGEVRQLLTGGAAFFEERVGGGVRIHPENARMSGQHGVQYVAQCVACAALTPVVWQ